MKTAYNVRVDRTVRGDIGVDRTWEGVNRTVEESSVNSGQWLASLRTDTSVGNMNHQVTLELLKKTIFLSTHTLFCKKKKKEKEKE
jgi:hypothetical protein